MNSLRLKKMSYLKFKFFFSSDEDGTFWPGVVELPVEKELTTENISNDENKNQRIITGLILFVILSLFFLVYFFFRKSAALMQSLFAS